MNVSLLSNRMRIAHLVLASVAIAIIVVAFAMGSVRAWPAYLVGAIYFVTIALGAVLFLAIHHATNAAWSTVIRRVPEAMTGYMPVAAIFMLVTILGAGSLYEWSHAGAVPAGEAMAFKASWLQVPFFAVRMVIVLGAWVLFAVLLRRESLRQDVVAGLAPTMRLRIISGAFLVVLAITITAASVDWLMSIDLHFYSTLYGWYVFAGVFECGIAATAIVTIWLRRRGVLEAVTDEHMHSLGKMVFAFATFWAYLWFCQYMLIYYTNLPEEGIYYTSRSAVPGGDWAFYLNLALGWMVPFVLLLGRGAKRRSVFLLIASVSVLLGHYVDIAIIVLPPTVSSSVPGIVDIAVMLGFGAMFLLVTDWYLRRAPVVPMNDPYLDEAIGVAHHEHGASALIS